MALNSLLCADVLLRNYSLSHPEVLCCVNSLCRPIYDLSRLDDCLADEVYVSGCVNIIPNCE